MNEELMIALLDHLTMEEPALVLEWISLNVKVVGGDMYMDGPDDWWLDDPEYDFV